ncbi:MAG: ferredoxin-type protein NapF [Betaproteobacteria bacterium]|nr:ferredoxin-type protein NapF [Betaproteobacteria bacterium]MCL2885415.1 ferredoxin-type protein NapF [Betaproteobacteria bacterium]
MVDAARRGFLRGRSRPKAELRPPWALPEAAFVDHCTRCRDCLPACPQGIVVSGDGGYPRIDFSRGECTFCAACVTACQPQALLRREGEAPWACRASVGAACLPQHGVECRVCGDYCAAGAIRFPPRLGGSPLPAIDAERCTGCGACLAPCPGGAIQIA